jgi:hypothetical protein
VLEHLLEIDYEPEVLNTPKESFTSEKKLSAVDLLQGQIETTEWLEELGARSDEEVLQTAQENQARDAFKALVATPTEAKGAIQKLTVPPAVKKLVGMLTAYDWAFVEQAKEIRGMAVAKILEETDHPDARIRLKALELLGRVTEVGLFTDRIEVKKTELSDSELDAKIKDKLLAIQNTIEAPKDDENVTDVEENEPSE